MRAEHYDSSQTSSLYLEIQYVYVGLIWLITVFIILGNGWQGCCGESGEFPLQNDPNISTKPVFV